MYGSSRIGGAPSSSNPPPHQAAQQGQPTPPPTFELKRPGSNAGASDDPEPSAKRSRHTGAFGTSAQPTAPVNSNRQLIQQRLLNHMQLPTRTQTPSMDFIFASGVVGLQGMAAAGAQGGQATSTRTHAPSRRGPQTTTRTQAPGLPGQSATPRSGGTTLRSLLPRPMPPSSNPSSTASTVAPSVSRPLPPTGTPQRTTQAPATGPSVATPASGNDHQLIHMLARPYVDAELTRLWSTPPSSTTSTTASRVAMPFPFSQGAQGTPFVPAPPVHVASAATARATLPAAQSTFPPFSSLGLTAEDLNQRDMMDEYLQGMPMGQSAGPTPTAWVNPVPRPLAMSSASTATPASDPAPRNPPGI